MDTSGINVIVIVSVMSYSMVYIFISALFEHKRIHCLHETGVAMIIGLVVGLIVFLAFNSDLHAITQFNDKVVFYIILPPMLFSDGFNLKKRRFFQNIFYINIYGIIGSLLNFVTVVGFMVLINRSGLIMDLSHNVRSLDTAEILLFAACMCSMDDIASVSTIKPEVHPKLFSVIFGESLLKDVVTIVLFSSISDLIVNTKGSFDFDFLWYDPFKILGDFLLTVFVSVLIGIAFSIVITLIFKHFRFINHTKGIADVGLTFLIGLVAYLTSQIIGYSGIVSMMVTGIFLSHFNIYNMSEPGIVASRITFKTVSIIAQGILFLLIGLASWQFQTDQRLSTVSWTFIGFGFIAMFLGRFVNIAVTTLIFYFCVGKDKWRLNIYQLQIITFAGVVRGAVPFALIGTISPGSNASNQTIANISMLKATIIFIVSVSSLFFNGLIPSFIKWRTRVMKDKIRQDHQSNIDTLREQQKRAYQSQLRGQTNEQRKYRGQTQKYWKKFQQGFIKPFLIFNYKGRRQQIRQKKKKQRFQQFGLPVMPDYKQQQIQMTDLSKSLMNNQEVSNNADEEELSQSRRDTVFHSIKDYNIKNINLEMQNEVQQNDN